MQREQLFRDALELEPAERTELLELLIDSLDGLDAESDEDVEEAWAEEIDKRIAELDAGVVTAEPWDKVRKRLRNAPDG